VSDAEALTALGLRVVFRRLADRYAHVIETVHGGEVVAIAESLEGTAEEDWPRSPALQQLHFETRPDGSRLALLVGRAGTSHWSLSVEAKPDSPLVIFDVACRVRELPVRLGSEYRLLSEANKASAHPSSDATPCIQFATAARLQLEPVKGAAESTLILGPEPSTNPIGIASQELRWPSTASLQSPSRAIRIEPPAVAGPWPKTVRWRYSIIGPVR
jgi:hypothetical protein